MRDAEVRSRVHALLDNACGPARRNTLVGFVESLGITEAHAEKIIAEMIDSGELEMQGSKRGARYGNPKVAA